MKVSSESITDVATTWWNDGSTSDSTPSQTGQTTQTPSCELFPGDPSKCDTILWCKYVFSILSILGSIFTLVIIWLFKKYGECTQRMIANLSVASLLVASAYLISEISHLSTGFCIFQGAFLQYNLWTVMLWYMCIMFNLLSNAIWNKPIEQFERFYVAFCWGFPLLMVGLPFIEDVYGPAGSWCWLKNDWEWRFGTWYIWSILSVVLVLVLMIWIMCVLHRRPNFQSNVKALRLYPVVYFLVNVFPVANRIQNAVDNFKDQEGYVFALLLLQTICGPLLGVANAVVFVLDRPTVDAINYQTIKAALIRRFDKKGVIREYPIKDFEINIVQKNSFLDTSTTVDLTDISSSSIIDVVGVNPSSGVNLIDVSTSVAARNSRDSVTTTTISDSGD